MSSAAGTIERRQHTRVDASFAANFRVLSSEHVQEAQGPTGYKPPELLRLDLHDSPAMRTVTANISEGGFCLLSEIRLPESSHLLIDVLMPGRPLPVRLLAQVVRTQNPEGNQRFYRLGVKILAISQGGLERLRELVKERALLNGMAA